ncbi:MBL fold metallo-hydrolase [Marivirga tractuosa]|uniref:Metal-dependent hydrolase n=1 Tax=Marivirga tractuosa (strain ATCC 23168 / DSM 4126 / NBRC 15989 / NCIMB 1408 / VKM B-1430 / H-43) TaxID=643867 RepID=E4TSL5_MARTH|nr:MBL fold metallo-hydrolase [Marivirga tractuosa]ADR20835.1 metal-dependent hydrolase [Marivirga tractuosa DSM 4126]BDD14714.1 MBL fold metallo-hydrolase [Marivirga tractuosa]
MKVTFLGTGTSQGVPVIACDCEVCRSLDYRDKRTRTSIHIEIEGKSIVFDTGPDFREQMLRERVSNLDAVVYTHEHKDHTAGLDDVRSYNFKQDMDMPVYGRKQVLEQIQREFAYIFAANKYPGIPKVKLHEIENKPFQVEGIDILPINVMHYKLPVFGYRIKDFTYITDVNHIPEEEKEKIRGSKILVLSALQKKSHLSHFNLEQAIAMVEELEIPQAYFIHMGHRMGLHRNIEEELPEGMELAYDGLQIEL